MLTKGNSKLGEDGLIWAFSLPAIFTCPGRTALCERLCYANSGHYNWPSVQDALWFNYRATLDKDFVAHMLELLQLRHVRVCRLHVAGDFYSVDYAAAWFEIMARSPTTRFYLYTRSWRDPDIRATLEEMAELPGVSMWWSVDAQTGHPADLPAGVRVSYLMEDDTDLPADAVDLVFRDQDRTVRKSVDGVLVCPVENGVTHTTCSKCRVCFSPPGRRFALPLAVATVA